MQRGVAPRPGIGRALNAPEPFLLVLGDFLEMKVQFLLLTDGFDLIFFS